MSHSTTMKKPTVREIARYCYDQNDNWESAVKMGIVLADRCSRDYWRVCLRILVLAGILEREIGCRCQLCRIKGKSEYA